MSARSNHFRPVRIARAVVLGVLLAPAFSGEFALADPPPSGQTATVGKCVSPAGTLLRRSNNQHTWEPVPTGEAISSADHLLALPGDKAAVEAADGGVRVTLWGNAPALGPWPPLESAVAMKPNAGGGLNLELDRGRLLATRISDTGSHRFRVQFGDQHWGVSLEEPGTEVSIERVAGWLRGVSFSLKRLPHDVPRSAVVLWVLKGAVDLQAGAHHYSLRAPPGPAYFHWDSIRGQDSGPVRRDQLPDWLEEGSGTDAKRQEIRAAVQARRQGLCEGPAEKALLAGLREHEPQARSLAVYGLAAIDHWKQVARALNDSDHADVRESAVRALINWLGRKPSHEAELYHYLVNEQHASPRHAEITCQLLLGFPDEALGHPETYETLIAYLGHTRLPIRQLADWNLRQIAPAGRQIAYDPAGSAEERERAVQAWKKLIPTGKLPPSP
jgi:hypothetical protein